MKKLTSCLAALALLLGVVFVSPNKASAAACSVPATSYGAITNTVSIPTAATYRVWSRMSVPDTANNSFALEIDGTSCYIVGGSSSIAPNTWTWVDYQGGTATNKVQSTLSAGSHTFKMIGLAPNVKLDKII